jgi:DnaJ-class molecular chaperone
MSTEAKPSEREKVLADLVREGARRKCPDCGGQGSVKTSLIYAGQDLFETCVRCHGKGTLPDDDPFA